ncbi:MAG: gliding motility-associated C-terminal domain-containing protein, partial [Lewinellaceae bacterium]|nr:gliding motility-associated C-terminal domain-containing protein [Lewinellaceae bacterium]
QAGCPGLAGGAGTAQQVSLTVNLTATHPPCFGTRGTVQANAGSNFTPLSFSWNTGAGQPFVTNQPAGIYTVTVTTPQGCSQVATAALIEPPLLTSAIGNVVNINCYTPIGSADLSAQGGTPPYQYAWNNGGQQTQNVFVAGGTYTVTVTDANQCTAVASAAVAQNTTPPTAAAAANEAITCNTPEVLLSSAGSSAGTNFIYTWSTQNGSIVSDMEEPTATVNAPGAYTLLITNTTNGCTAAAQALVTENTNYPTALDLQITQPGCNDKPGAVQVQGVQGGAGPFVFSINDGQDFLTQDVFENLTPGQYSIVVQDINGCEHEQVFVLVPPVEPEVQIVPEVQLDYGQTAELTLLLNVPAEQLDSILWTPPSGISTTNRPDVVLARPFVNTLYTVTVVSKEGCRDEAEVLILVGKPHIYAPNVFRPGSADGLNSQFMLFARDQVVNQISRMQIFDRWGNLVFGRDNILLNDSRSGGWDGRYKGKLLEPGVFTWWADIELASGEHISMKGDVTLVD